MNAAVRDVEQKIDKLLSTGFGLKHNVVSTISEIAELRYNDYNDLKNDVVAGNAVVRQAPGGPLQSLFVMCATHKQSTVFDVLTLLAFALPIAGIGLAVFVNWWWLLLLLGPIITMSLAKKVYLSALFSAIGSSEKAFCFAFCGNGITVELQNGTICYRGMNEEKIEPPRSIEVA